MSAGPRPPDDSPAETPGTDLVPQPHGGALMRGGNWGNKGGGRPPDEFRAKMRELASSPEAIDYLGACVHGEHGPKAAISAWRLISERGYGRVPQHISVSSALDALDALDMSLLDDRSVQRLADGEDVVTVLLEIVLEGTSPATESVRGILPALLMRDVD